MNLEIPKGPHGLREIDTYVEERATPAKPFTVYYTSASGAAGKDIIIVKDANGRLVGDAYLPKESTKKKREAAMQFLLDLVSAAF